MYDNHVRKNNIKYHQRYLNSKNTIILICDCILIIDQIFDWPKLNEYHVLFYITHVLLPLLDSTTVSILGDQAQSNMTFWDFFLAQHLYFQIFLQTFNEIRKRLNDLRHYRINYQKQRQCRHFLKYFCYHNAKNVNHENESPLHVSCDQLLLAMFSTTLCHHYFPFTGLQNIGFSF